MTIKEFAKKEGYNDKVRAFKWHGYDCFEVNCQEERLEDNHTGLPIFVIKQGSTFRYATAEESYAILGILG